MRRVALALALSIGCASAPAWSNERAEPRRGGGGSAAGGHEQGAGGPAAGQARVAWRECAIDGRAVWMPIPEGAAFDAERDGCFVLPGAGATPETADWLLAIGRIEEGDSNAELLAIEPDGARRFLVEDAEIEGVRSLGEGTMSLLGTPTRWYSLRGVADELGARDVTIARIRAPGGWLIAVAATRWSDPARLEQLWRLVSMARVR